MALDPFIWEQLVFHWIGQRCSQERHRLWVRWGPWTDWPQTSLCLCGGVSRKEVQKQEWGGVCVYTYLQLTQHCKTTSCCSVTNLCLTLATPRTVACQAALSLGFSRQECRSGLPFSSPGDLFPTQGLNTWQADSLSLNHQGSPKQIYYKKTVKESI